MILRRALLPVLLAVAFGGPHDLQAQGAGSPATRLLVIRYALKPDHVAQWLELQKTAVVPAPRAAGVKHQVVYETVPGDAPEYTSVTPIAGFEEFDAADPLVRALGAAGARQLNERLAACIQSMHRSMENRREDFFLDPRDAAVQYASKYRAMPGKNQAYMEFFKSEMMPVMRKAQAAGTFAGLDVTVSVHGGEYQN